jgi:RhtB (resistance to homoserine/threonine) family protein
MYITGMEFFFNWLMIAMISLAAAMSPGPDFVIMVRNSIIHSRTASIMTAIGIGVGICIHMTYCIFGIAIVISQSVILFNTLKYAGTAYLIYIGYKSLRSAGYDDKNAKNNDKKKTLSSFAAIRGGLLTNLLNPKATMFFLALFTQVIDPHTPFKVLVLYAGTVVFTCFSWWLFVAIFLTNIHIKNVFLGFSKWIDRTCGGLMIALGLKLALTKVT